MPKRKDLKTICVLGSGPVIIGQAAEFDYSGTQAIKALKEEGYKIVLINSNPATIMTDKSLADRTYIEPMTWEYVNEILKIERPCALLPTVGGQTALNLAVKLSEQEILQKLNIELIGADVKAIKKAEDRELFKKAMQDAGLPTLKSCICNNLESAQKSLDQFGLPCVIRPSFTLGGTGGGIAYTQEEFTKLIKTGIDLSPTSEILIEESVIGHKEFEFEVIRDAADNAVIVCSIENFDPMGVHTGDSITVAPQQTLSDVEYQILRNASLKVLRVIGVKTGGSNVQFSVNPKTGEFFVIEMNPRVSRSSALASKATGYPIAKVAAKLAVGYLLDEIINDITKKTTAAFEPALDYVVVKIPKFAFEKFSNTEPELTTQMRSVGEVMAMGRSFQESLQKAMVSLEDSQNIINNFLEEKDGLLEELKRATPKRLYKIFEALRCGYSVDDIVAVTSIDSWFIEKIKHIINTEQKLLDIDFDQLNLKFLTKLKQDGFLDSRIAVILGVSEKDIFNLRKKLNILPQFNQVDTCAGEFKAHTPYFYSTYELGNYKLIDSQLVAVSNSPKKISNKKKIIVIGSGPIRIGQGIEFDCCATECVLELKKAGFETIMVNCNPETVSTDFDIADKLYFEPLTLEHVLNIINHEQPTGVIIQLGGQTPLALAHGLSEHGVNILGTSPENIDQAEDRQKSAALLNKINIRQPPSCSVNSLTEALHAVEKLGYPVMIRPSYVLGGRSMQRAHNQKDFNFYIQKALNSGRDKPVLIDRFLDGAIEIDVDALSDGTHVYVAGILQHVEEAGIHSGDSACVLPPYDLSKNIICEIKKTTIKLCHELRIVGLLNIQYAIKNELLYIIEANPRASRTVPFISKATGVAIARIAGRIICGEKLGPELRNKSYEDFIKKDLVAVKAPVMPFKKFPNSDPLLGPEMRSTGEVMCTAAKFEHAFLKSLTASGTSIDKSGGLFVSIADRDKENLLWAISMMAQVGYTLFATSGTHWFLKAHGISSKRVKKVREGSPHVLDLIETGQIKIMFNTILGSTSVHDSHLFRKKALIKNIPYFTSVSAAKAVSQALCLPKSQEIMQVRALQDEAQV